MAARKRKSKTPWGWIAFGVGLAACVGVGGVVGVMLGQEDSPSDADARRVAALALDARGLNEDALSLSRAIEEAITREELESEAESLRTELNRLDARAERIRVRAESETDAAQTREVSRAVKRGLGEISNTVAVFERDVVDSLEPVLREPSAATAPVEEEPEPADPSFEEALAEVNRVLEEQGETMTAVVKDLDEADEAAGPPVTDDIAAFGDELVSGSFDAALIPSEGTLEVGYEFEALQPESEISGAGPEEATITSTAAGGLTLKNTGSKRERVGLPTFQLALYWNEADFPSAALSGLVRAEESSEDIEEAEVGEGMATASGGSNPCQYEIEGEPHCELARLAFDGKVDHARNAAGELVLHPGDEVRLDAPEPDGSLAVTERRADTVVEFIETHSPDFVEVLATGFEAEAFQSACLPPYESGEDVSEGIIVEPYPKRTLGLLTGDGKAIFEAGEASRPTGLDSEAEPEGPECYRLRGGY